MQVISKTVIEEKFDFSELSSMFLTVVRQAIQDPIYWYVFLHRYTHFNSFASGAAYRLASSIALSRYLFREAGSIVLEEADRGSELADQFLFSILKQEFYQHSSRRTLVQTILKSAGDTAGLLPEERNFLGTPPEWLKTLVNQFINHYQGVPGNIASITRAVGFHTASELLDQHECSQLGRTYLKNKPEISLNDCLINHLPSTFFRGDSPPVWCSIVGRGPWTESSSQPEMTAIDAMNFMIEHRAEPSKQMQGWIYEGIEAFIQLQSNLLQGIYRECLEIAHVCQEPMDITCEEKRVKH